MSAPTSTVYQFNFKIGNDLHNIYADSLNDAVDLLAAFEETILPAIFSAQQKVHAANSFAAVTPAPAAATRTAGLPGPTPAATPSADQDMPRCDHGLPARFVPAGISKKTNKPYPAFYACAQGRESQCGFKQSVD